MRAPFPLTWFEWCDRPVADSPRDGARPVPKRLGCLVEAGGELDRGMYAWAWQHSDESIVVLPYSVMFDYRLDADLPAQAQRFGDRAAALSPGQIDLLESVIGIRIDAAEIADNARRVGEAIDAISSADLAAAGSRWRRVAGDPEEVIAARALARQLMPVPSYHCLGIWQRSVDPTAAAPAIASWHEDLAGEDSFAQAFLTLLNARNALDTKREDLARLNRRRTAKGHTPLCQFTVTRLHLSQRAVARAAAQGRSRAAARQHLVRGHFKTRASGIYWWSPFLRGRGEAVTGQRYAVT
jgi:hypothetical protein